VQASAQSPTERAFRVGVLGNGVAALIKVLVGWAAGSRALVADGGHSLVNLALAGAAWLVHHFQGRAGRRLFGRGKLEAFAGLLLGLAITFAGLWLLAYAWMSGARPSGGFAASLALSVAILSVVANGAGYWVARRAEQETQSQALALLAKGHVSDALASTLVILAWIGTRAGFDLADALCAFAVGGLVLWMGWRFARSGFDALMDRADPELSLRVAETVRPLDRVKGVGEVDAYPMGRRFEIDLEIMVDPRLTVEEAGRIALAVETAVLRAHPTVCEVYVRTNPAPSTPDRTS